MIERYTPVTRDRNANHPNANASNPGTSTIISSANAEMVEAVPKPRQRLPVEEHHEVGQDGIAVHAPRADLAHQIHAHGVAAERKEGRVPEAQNAAVSPDQIHGQRQQRIAEILADQREPVGRDVKRRRRGHNQIEDGHQTTTTSARPPRNQPVPESLRALIHSVYWRAMPTGSPTRGRLAGTGRAAASE